MPLKLLGLRCERNIFLAGSDCKEPLPAPNVQCLSILCWLTCAVPYQPCHSCSTSALKVLLILKPLPFCRLSHLINLLRIRKRFRGFRLIGKRRHRCMKGLSCAPESLFRAAPLCQDCRERLDHHDSILRKQRCGALKVNRQRYLVIRSFIMRITSPTARRGIATSLVNLVGRSPTQLTPTWGSRGTVCYRYVHSAFGRVNISPSHPEVFASLLSTTQ